MGKKGRHTEEKNSKSRIECNKYKILTKKYLDIHKELYNDNQQYKGILHQLNINTDERRATGLHKTNGVTWKNRILETKRGTCNQIWRVSKEVTPH